MKIFIIDKFGNHQLKETTFIPRIGDRIDLSYTPCPAVSEVLLWPTDSLKAGCGVQGEDIEAIIVVE